jgi:hypothetical protein
VGLAYGQYHFHHNHPCIRFGEGPVRKGYLGFVGLGGGHHRRNRPRHQEDGLDNSLKDALREGMVDKVVGSMHHDVVVDLMRNRGSNYERGREGYVARRLRYVHRNC